MIEALEKPEGHTLSRRGTSEEGAGGRGINPGTTSPLPSPPSDGGEGEIGKLPTRRNRTSLVRSTATRELDDAPWNHFGRNNSKEAFSAVQRSCYASLAPRLGQKLLAANGAVVMERGT